jgi:hypothetical protein
MATCSNLRPSCGRRRGSALVSSNTTIRPCRLLRGCWPIYGVAEADKDRLKAMLESADPVILFAGIRAAQEELGRRVDRRGLNARSEEPVAVDLQRFTLSLKTAWQVGEKRPTHRRPYRRTKPYPKRQSMLEPFEPQIRAWLEADPAVSAASVLERLMSADPSRFTRRACGRCKWPSRLGASKQPGRLFSMETG